MKIKGGLFALVGLTAIMVMTGCMGGGESSTPQLTPADLNTNNTDATKLTRSYEGKSFIDDADGNIGIVRFRSCTDGDTANFFSGTEKIKIRFLGVNTPESTAKIEPWGLAASVYVCNIISDPTTVLVAENDVPVFEKTDNSGNRHLGFLWYKKAGQTDFRLLNLELIDLAYSTNQLFKDSTLCPYTKAFEDADAYARKTGAKVYGETDISYDYSDEVITISLSELRRNYDKYGKTGTSSGRQLRIRALVVGMIGDNMVLRDINPDVNDGDDVLLAGMYAYAGYNTSLATFVGRGDVVEFYCKATTFNGAIQLSDLKTSTLDRKYPFIVEQKGLTGPTEKYPHATIEPFLMDSSTFGDYTDFAPFVGRLIETIVTVRLIDETDVDEDGTQVETGNQIYIKKDANNNYTCYANSQGVQSTKGHPLALNIRVDGTSYPYVSEQMFTVGNSYKVRGYLAPYFEKYQIILLNNVNGYCVEELA